MVAKPLWFMNKTTTPPLALKWVVMEHFEEYLPYQPFLVRTDNNPLTYIVKTPNLDTTGYQWVGSLASFNFQLEYQKGQDNTVADMLSQITMHLSPEPVWFILDGVTLGATHRAEGYDPAVVEGDHEIHMTDWAETQREDPVLNDVLNWLEAQKKTDLKTLLGEHASSKEGWLDWRNHQNCMIHQKGLYLCSMPKGENEDLLLFVVPKAHWVASLNGCYQDAGTSGSWPCLVLIARALLVARDDQPDVAIHQNLHTLSTVQGQLAQGPLTPHHGYCFPGSPTCWLHQHRDHFGAKPVT